jgi:hypothetical protein
MSQVDPAEGVRDIDPATLEACHQVEVAVEWIERSFGSVLDAHHEVGRGLEMLLEAADALEAAGQRELAERARREAARDAVGGRWTYQIVDEFRSHLLEPLQGFGQDVRDRLSGGLRNRREALLKAGMEDASDSTAVETQEG